MKTFIHTLSVGLVSAALLCTTAQARPRTIASEPSAVSTGGGPTFWAGVASATSVTDSANPALSVLIGFNDKLALQTYALLDSTSPFTFGLGANLKYSIIGDTAKGFHLGGGVGLGTLPGTKTTIDPITGQVTTSSTIFFVNINAIAGFHYEIIDRLLVGVDAGPTLTITDGKVDFNIRGYSAWLGLSLLYRL